MILKEDSTKTRVFYEPEGLKERKLLDAMPAFERIGLLFFTSSKQSVVRNLYTRLLRKKVTPIRYTPFVKELIHGSQKVQELPENFKFHTEPLEFQRLALRYLYNQRGGGLLMEPGLGKTKVILDYIFLMGFPHSLIACPKPLLGVWEEEIEKHRPELSFCRIETPDWENEKIKILQSRVSLISYNRATSLQNELQSINFSFLGVDEGLIKNYATARSDAFWRLSQKIPYKSIMSGTLITRAEIDCFSPIRFLELGLIGDGVTRFKNEYAMMSKKTKGRIFSYRNVSELRSILEACSIVMTKEQWLSYLPAKKFHTLTCQMSEEQRRIFLDLSRENLAVLEDGTELDIDNPLVLMTKLIQISNGFLYYNHEIKDIEDLFGEESKLEKKKKVPRLTFRFPEQPKLDLLQELVTSKEKMGNRRAIIWYNYQEEGLLIAERLTQLGIPFSQLLSSDKDVMVKVNEFNNDPSIRFFLSQAKRINYGVTVLGKRDEIEEEESEDDLGLGRFSFRVADEIFYSMNFSLEVYLQQQDRIHRIGQTEECNYWILMTNNSVERRIAELLTNKLSVKQNLMVDIALGARLEEFS